MPNYNFNFKFFSHISSVDSHWVGVLMLENGCTWEEAVLAYFACGRNMTAAAAYIHKRREDEEEGEGQLNQIKERELRERQQREQEFLASKAERNRVNPDLLEEQLEKATHTMDRTGPGYPEPYKKDEGSASAKSSHKSYGSSSKSS